MDSESKSSQGRTSFGERMYAIAKAMSENDSFRDLPPGVVAPNPMGISVIHHQFCAVVALQPLRWGADRFCRSQSRQGKRSRRNSPVGLYWLASSFRRCFVVLMFSSRLADMARYTGVEGQTGPKPFGGLLADGLISRVGNRSDHRWCHPVAAEPRGLMRHTWCTPSSLLILGYVSCTQAPDEVAISGCGVGSHGLSVAYPLQILILRFGAGVVGDSYGTGIVITAFVAALPIIAGFISAGWSTLFALAGGTTTISGETNHKAPTTEPKM